MIDISSHSRSLRNVLYLGVGGGSALFLITAAILGIFWGSRVSRHSDTQVRILSRLRAHQALMGSLQEQQVALQGYLVTGETQQLDRYHESQHAEEDSLVSLQDNMTDEEEAQANQSLKRLNLELAAWHHFAGDAIKLRNEGPLKQPQRELDTQHHLFEALRREMSALDMDLGKNDNLQLRELENAMAEARWIAILLIGTALVTGFLITRHILQKVSRPLVELSAFAHQDAGFPEPEVVGVREVDILSQALYELDLRVREREQRLVNENQESVASQMYMALLQQLSREEDVLEAFQQAAQRTFQLSDLRVFLQPVGSKRLQLSIPPGGHEALLGAGAPLPRLLGESLACRAVRQGALVALEADAPTACVCPLGVPAQGSYLCLPLAASGQTLGLVNLQSRHPNYWNSHRIRRASMLVSGTAAALQLIHAVDLAKERAIRDGLTEVYNRRFLDEITPKMVEQALRKQQPLSLLMLDIDHFKRFNDEYGHDAGDQVLVSFARCIENCLRVGDIVARYGGEEFSVFLPQTTYLDALALAERLRHAITTIHLPASEFPLALKVHTSIGVATLPDQAATAESLFSIADKALYEAKGCGRNRVVGAMDLGSLLG